MKDESCTLDAKLLGQLATDVLQALQFISSCGIHHNNVNMNNILIKKADGEVRTLHMASLIMFKAKLKQAWTCSIVILNDWGFLD